MGVDPVWAPRGWRIVASMNTKDPNGLDLTAWIGRSETSSEPVGLWRARAMAAALDRPAPAPILALGSPLPFLWHWLYCVSTVPQQALAEDGHPPRGDFMPPVSQPQRMWAGGKLEFHRQIPIGDNLRRDSSIIDIRQTEGSHGEMVFVGLQHRYATDQGLAVLERQDVVYRHPMAAGQPPRKLARKWAPITIATAGKRTICPDERLLFRYSALSFNAHRIHYDLEYARSVEGYPGLLVHGPLLATLLLDLWFRGQNRPLLRALRVRALAPAFAGQPLELCVGKPAAGTQTLWAQNGNGDPLQQIELDY